jgi:hypothetical protein
MSAEFALGMIGLALLLMAGGMAVIDALMGPER